MNTPPNRWRFGKRLAQVGGLVMVMIGLVWILGQSFAVYVSPQRGLITAEATVISLDQRGTFQEPAFSITLSYPLAAGEGTTTIRSGKRVDYATYSRLALDDVVTVRFDPVAPHEWTLLTPITDPIRSLIPAAALIAGGLLLALFPWMLRLGSRAGDFERNNGEHLQIS